MSVDPPFIARRDGLFLYSYIPYVLIVFYLIKSHIIITVFHGPIMRQESRTNYGALEIVHMPKNALSQNIGLACWLKS